MATVDQTLYLALYFRPNVVPLLPGKEDRYHWALLSVPNDPTPTSQALRLHARDYFSGPSQTTWYYEELRVPIGKTPKLLSMTPIGEILDMEKFLEIVRDVPVVQGDGEWNCIIWIRQALEGLREDGEALVFTEDWCMERFLGEVTIDSEEEVKENTKL